MTSPTDTSVPAWAWSWVRSRFGEPRSAVRVRSSEVNAVFRLEAGGEGLFLKVGPRLRPEYDRLRWLEGRLPAPRPVDFTIRDDKDALLTTAVEGDDLAVLSTSLPPAVIVARLAAALRAVHGTPTADWRLGGDGSVLVHGDACLPNFLYLEDDLSGYIDVGNMSLGEPEDDLAAAVWSLQYNLGAGYGLAFLCQYGVTGADEDDVESLRLRYERQ